MAKLSEQRIPLRLLPFTVHALVEYQRETQKNLDDARELYALSGLTMTTHLIQDLSIALEDQNDAMVYYVLSALVGRPPRFVHIR